MWICDKYFSRLYDVHSTKRVFSWEGYYLSLETRNSVGMYACRDGMIRRKKSIIIMCDHPHLVCVLCRPMPSLHLSDSPWNPFILVKLILSLSLLCIAQDVQFQQQLYAVGEGDGMARVGIVMDRVSPENITLNFQTIAGTATGMISINLWTIW